MILLGLSMFSYKIYYNNFTENAVLVYLKFTGHQGVEVAAVGQTNIFLM